jgi:protein SCO1/2
MKLWRVLVLALLISPGLAFAHDSASKISGAMQSERLPVIGTAPSFDLVSQDGHRVKLADYRGRVLAIAFIFTSCPDVCPMLTANMAQVQQDLGSEFGRSIAFVSITVDPEHDTPPVLKEYADNFAADLSGWTFLTGDPKTVRDVVRRYGVFARTSAAGDVAHTLLTSLVDGDGQLRVQYMGERFDLEEFRRDLLSLVGKAH